MNDTTIPPFLANFSLFINGVLTDPFVDHYFEAEEKRFLRDLLESLSVDAQKLFARLFVRKRAEFFRISDLRNRYEAKKDTSETDKFVDRLIGNVWESAKELLDHGILSRLEERVSVQDAIPLLGSAELHSVVSGTGIVLKGRSIGELRESLCMHFPKCRSRRVPTVAGGLRQCAVGASRTVDRQSSPNTVFPVDSDSDDNAECVVVGEKKGKMTSLERFLSGRGHRSSVQTTLDGKRVDVVKRIQTIVGPVLSLSEDVLRTLSFARLVFFIDKDISALTVTQLAITRYPKVARIRKTPLFRCPEALHDFADAQEMEAFFSENTDGAGGFEDCALPVLYLAIDWMIAEAEKESHEIWDGPAFLAQFSRGAVMARLISHGLVVLQKQRDYVAEVEVLQALLACPFSPDRRGSWYNRLTLDLKQHLKRTEDALEWCHIALEEGMKGSIVPSDRIALQKRYMTLVGQRKNKKPRLEGDVDVSNHCKTTGDGDSRFLSFSWLACPEKTIFGERSEISGRAGPRYRGSVTNSESIGVEAFALEQYVTMDEWESGFHTEGRVWTTLFGLFLYDVLFLPVPDAFLTEYQSHPLDLMVSDEFYVNRKDALEERFRQISQMSGEELQNALSEVWVAHENEAIIGVNWERHSLDSLCNLVECLGGVRCVAVFRPFTTGYRWWCTGMPDLVVWNRTTSSVLLVEVKSTNDRLSDRQHAWIDVLMRSHIDVEVCHVRFSDESANPKE